MYHNFRIESPINFHVKVVIKKNFDVRYKLKDK